MKQRNIAIAIALTLAGALHAPLVADEIESTIDEVVVQAVASDAIDLTAHLEQAVESIGKQVSLDLQSDVQIALDETFGPDLDQLVVESNR